VPITLDDLTVNFDHLDRDTLLADWHRLIGPSKLPILLPRIGNAFVQDANDGSVHLLDVGAGELYPVADTFEEFRALLTDRTFVMEHFAVEIVVALPQAGVALGPGQIYGFKVPPLLGGEYTRENTEATDITVHFSLLGQIAQQVSDLPPGTPITGVTVSE
jgi:hypothetical protein